MKNLFRFFVLALALVVPSLARAQTTIVQTTLAAAITSTSQTAVTVASTSNISASTASAQQFLYVNRELMRINAVNSSTNVLTVVRGWGNTIATRHNNQAVVFAGQGGSRWNAATGDVSGPGPFILTTPQGPCTPANQPFTASINTATGDISVCEDYVAGAPGTVGLRGQWRTHHWERYSSNTGVTNVNNTNYTALLTDSFIHVMNVSAARTVTLPAITGIEGKVITVRNDGTGAAVTVAGSNAQGVGTGPGPVNTVGTVSLAPGAGMSFVSVLMSSLSTTAWTWVSTN